MGLGPTDPEEDDDDHHQDQLLLLPAASVCAAKHVSTRTNGTTHVMFLELSNSIASRKCTRK